MNRRPSRWKIQEALECFVRRKNKTFSKSLYDGPHRPSSRTRSQRGDDRRVSWKPIMKTHPARSIVDDALSPITRERESGAPYGISDI